MILRVENIFKSFGPREVLRGASFEVRRGELVGIVGENGAGKSTLLKVVMGLLRPSEGFVAADGTFGYCPQETVIFDSLTVRENYRYFAAAYSQRRASGGNNFDKTWRTLTERFRLAEYELELVSELSGGTKQKLNLALSLVHSPDILILDEPYSGFDWETYLRFWEYAAEMREQGKGILVVSHLISDRDRFDKIYDLKGGTLQCT